MTTADTYDSPWKEAIEGYFQEFVAFFFPPIQADVDWSRGYTFLDTELQQIMRDSELGTRLADKLVQVWTQQGTETWVLIHIEVQAQKDEEFAARMYLYNARIFDRYDRPVVSLAVLADEHPAWRPTTYHRTWWGCQMTFEFPTVKLLDYRTQWDDLERSRNPFATVVMAHLKTQETRHDPDQRWVWKFTLVRRLYEVGYTRHDVLNLFRVIDWLMALPK